VPASEPWNRSPSIVEPPPPSYDESIADLPPDYTSTDALAIAQIPEYSPFSSLDTLLYSTTPRRPRTSNKRLPSPSTLRLDVKSPRVDIDFGYCETGIKSHAKKKNSKPATKKPAAAPVDDGKKGEEAAGGGDNGGDPPADSGAAGGDGGDGGDGDKGKKKNKRQREEEERLKREEEERLKKEEEERLQKEEEERLQKEEEERLAKEAEEEAERKKKEEEDAAAAAAAAATTISVTKAAADLSWAKSSQNADDWASLGGVAGKKKKGKKGKVRVVPAPLIICRVALTHDRLRPHPRLLLNHQPGHQQHSTTSILTKEAHQKLT
jgi:hypothetical protein